MSKEYIERETLLAFLYNTQTMSRQRVIQCIESKERFPTADVEPVRHGYWIIGSVGIHCYCECSECKKESPSGTETPYCPNCGAKMDGGNK